MPVIVALLMVILTAGIMSSAKAKESQTTDWLATIPGYCQGLMETPTGPLVLDEMQEILVDDDSKMAATLKARQFGYSYTVVSAKAVAKSHILNNHLSVFTSMNLEDAKEKIRYARELSYSIPRRHSHKLITDNKMELEWSNGSRIVSMFRPRGKGPGDVYLDEFAYLQDPREALRGALGITAHGGQVVIGSTLKGNTGIPYEILTGDTQQPQFLNIKRYRVYWWQSSFLCNDVKAATRPVEVQSGQYVMAADLLSTEERVDKWASEDLKLIFSMMLLEDFQQEFELKPLEAEAAFIPWELISRCADKDIEVYDSYEELRENVKGELYAGFDVGRRRNASELFIFEKFGGVFYQRMLKTFRRMPFPEQRANLGEALRVLPIVRMCIDEGGLGMQLAEELSIAYPHIVEPVNFASSIETDVYSPDLKSKKKSKKGASKGTVGVKARMATDVKISMERGRIRIYRDRELMNQIYSIKRNTTAAGNIQYDSDKNEKHHADRFWAMALALFGGMTSKPGLLAPIMVFPGGKTV